MMSGSDADWILLVDGQSFPEHQEQTTDAGQLLHDNQFGEDDKNSNTTRRVLLLLESIAVGDAEAYNRVRRQILNRYIRDDRGLLYGSGQVKVPRFLLNDLTRYWRTVTVDFVYKQRADAGKKWALRNAKLRMSRKLVFTSGLLRCFFCQIDPAAAQARESLIHRNDPTDLLSYLEGELIKTHSVVWQEIREMSHQFQSGLNELFYGEDEALKELMISYGVF